VSFKQKLALLEIIEKYKGNFKTDHVIHNDKYFFMQVKTNAKGTRFDFSAKCLFTGDDTLDPLHVTKNIRLEFSQEYLTLARSSEPQVQAELQKLREGILGMDEPRFGMREVFRRPFCYYYAKHGFTRLDTVAIKVLKDRSWQQRYFENLYRSYNSQWSPIFLNPVYIEIASFLKKEYEALNGKMETCFSHPEATVIIESALQIILKNTAGIDAGDLSIRSANITKVLQNFYRNIKHDYKQFYSMVHYAIENLPHIAADRLLNEEEIAAQVTLLMEKEMGVLKKEMSSRSESSLASQQPVLSRMSDKDFPPLRSSLLPKSVSFPGDAPPAVQSSAFWRNSSGDIKRDAKKRFFVNSTAGRVVPGYPHFVFMPSSSVSGALRADSKARPALTAEKVRILRRPSSAEVSPEVASSSSLAAPRPAKKASLANSSPFLTEVRDHAQVAAAQSAGRHTIRQGEASSATPSPVRQSEE